MSRTRVLLAVSFAALLTATQARAHSERPIDSPPRPGPVPDLARVNPNTLVVCKPASKPTAAELADIQQRLATTIALAALVLEPATNVAAFGDDA